MACAERLPLERQETMALQVTKCAIVRQYVEPIPRSLECPARFVTTVRAFADVGVENRRAIVG